MTFHDPRTGFVWASSEDIRGPQRTVWIDEATDGGKTWMRRWRALALRQRYYKEPRFGRILRFRQPAGRSAPPRRRRQRAC